MRLKRCVVFLALFLALLIPTVSEAGVSIVGGQSREKSVEIGKDYPGIIFIRNHGEEPQEVKIYQTDYLFFCGGTNIYGEPAGKDVRSNANWITFSPQRLTIPAKSTSAVNYLTEVPDDETLRGTYWSMLMVEGVGKDSPEAIEPEKDKIKVGIRQVIRYGIQMVTHIGNTGSRELEFLETELLKIIEENGGKKRILQVDVENTGERWLRPFLWVELYDMEGRYIGRFEGGRKRIYPGTSVRFKVDLTEVPKDEYKSLVIADCGGDDVFGITYTLKFQK